MSELDFIIPPEILNDELYGIIEQLAQVEGLKHVLEIGSSAGGGSTQAFLNGLSKNQSRPSFYCVELSLPRFNELKKALESYPFAKCYNVSSVPVSAFLSKGEVERFYNDVDTPLRQYPIERVLGWLQQDIDYVQGSGVPQEGIRIIKKDNNIDIFDLVLIDGSAFTGRAELNETIGAHLIVLDDVNDIKNYEGCQRLKADARYKLIAENWTLRNGYAVFHRIS